MGILDTFVSIAGAATKLASELPSAPASGLKTTEFWLTLITGIWSAIGGIVPAPWDGILPVVLVGIYTIGRTALKVFHMLGKANSLPDLPAVDPSMFKGVM